MVETTETAFSRPRSSLLHTRKSSVGTPAARPAVVPASTMGDESEQRGEERDKREERQEGQEGQEAVARVEGRCARRQKGGGVGGGDDGETRDGASAKQLVTWDSFEATCFPTRVKAALTSAGFTSPSEIQKRAWPPACEGRDVVAVAKTGSGKTLAFLLPMVYRLGLRHARDARSTLPTREAATFRSGDASASGAPRPTRSCSRPRANSPSRSTRSAKRSARRRRARRRAARRSARVGTEKRAQVVRR